MLQERDFSAIVTYISQEFRAHDLATNPGFHRRFLKACGTVAHANEKPPYFFPIGQKLTKSICFPGVTVCDTFFYREKTSKNYE